MENTVNWPEKLYKFTKVQGVIKTVHFKSVMTGNVQLGVYEDAWGGQVALTQLEVQKKYYTSLKSCYEAWIDSIDQFKEKVIKQFEKKCKINYYEYRKIKFKAWLDTQPEIKARMQKVADELRNSESDSKSCS